ncbi:TerD family protein [Streptomyces sp. NBC_01476]|uniref:TerD family protein n=1 Tax=Streptomyces sp. NBC_01476 TaxID=2903881 RepID=UPI002E33D4F2|nr:TerD family protein [Streptomyces sp. NBC_01476]
MTPGSNVPLAASRVTVEVAAAVRLDVSGLLLGAGGKVRSDDDFVFYNQPQGAGVTYRSGNGSGPDGITVDTGAVPADVEKIVVTASLDGGGPFAGVTPTATVRGADDGTEIATFAPTGLGPETALVIMEVYRRGGAWKVRAVGQGYADGLAGIATDFGVHVDEPAAPAPQVAAAPAAAPVPPAYAKPPTGPAATHLPPPPAAPPAAPPAPPVPPAPAAAPGRINLDKGRVSLRKNETVSLVKAGKPLLSSVRMGLGWEPAFGGRNIDLDASVIAYGPQRNPIATCYFGKLMVLNGAIQHHGDNLTGKGSGDDEAITVHLSGLPAEVTGLVFTVNSFSGQKFNKVKSAYCRLLDETTGEELVRFELSKGEARTGVLMAKMVKQFSGEWEMTALGEFLDARTARALEKPGAAAL